MPAFDEQLGHASSRPSVSAKTRTNRSETWDPQLSHSGIVLSITTLWVDGKKERDWTRESRWRHPATGRSVRKSPVSRTDRLS